jgi:hypothetical protein
MFWPNCVVLKSGPWSRAHWTSWLPRSLRSADPSTRYRPLPSHGNSLQPPAMQLTILSSFFLKGDFVGFFLFLCTILNTASSDSTVSEDADRTVATIRHWLSDALTTRLDLIHHCHYWARYKSRCFKVHIILRNIEIRLLVANITSVKFSLGCLWPPPCFIIYIYCMSEEEGRKKHVYKL